MPPSRGAIAQLGERYNGIVEVGGSIPPGSTIPEPPRQMRSQASRRGRACPARSLPVRTKLNNGDVPPGIFACAFVSRLPSEWVLVPLRLVTKLLLKAQS